MNSSRTATYAGACAATVRLLPSAAGLGLRQSDLHRRQKPAVTGLRVRLRAEGMADNNSIAGRMPVSSPGMSCIAAGAGATPRPISVGRTYPVDDPPNIGCCAAGPTMNCDDLAVIEYWHRPDWEWERDKALEIPIEEPVPTPNTVERTG